MDVFLGRVNRHVINIKDEKGEIPSIENITNIDLDILIEDVATNTACTFEALPNNNGFQVEWLAGDKFSWGVNKEIYLQVSLLVSGYNLKKTYYVGTTKEIETTSPPVESEEPAETTYFIPSTIAEKKYIIANSYLGIEEADIISQGVVYGDEFQFISDEAKRQFLLNATYVLDGKNKFKYEKTNTNQLLEFPRNGEFSIPRGIKVATVAHAIMMTIDQSLKVEKVGELSHSYNNRSIQIQEFIDFSIRSFVIDNKKEIKIIQFA